MPCDKAQRLDLKPKCYIFMVCNLGIYPQTNNKFISVRRVRCWNKRLQEKNEININRNAGSSNQKDHPGWIILNLPAFQCSQWCLCAELSWLKVQNSNDHEDICEALYVCTCAHVHVCVCAWERQSDTDNLCSISSLSPLHFMACFQRCVAIGQLDSSVEIAIAPLCVAMEMKLDNLQLLSNSLFPLLKTCVFIPLSLPICPPHPLIPL